VYASVVYASVVVVVEWSGVEGSSGVRGAGDMFLPPHNIYVLAHHSICYVMIVVL
jgi:hypothetical protein